MELEEEDFSQLFETIRKLVKIYSDLVKAFGVNLLMIVSMVDKLFLRPNFYNIFSSLNHKVWIHSNEFDPKGYFLYSVKCDNIGKNHSLIKGKIFDENKKCIASFIQDAILVQ
uniref:Acyl-CoA thioesterase II domain-containing protein n=1 Tax=Acrobeloides nanus TaxID=290746 RepID=A0A914C8U8_9BILA